jgi:hypothetical protein
MKYCVNCVHHSCYKANQQDYHVCYRIKRVSPVTGETTSVDLLCETERKLSTYNTNACGPSAVYFERI